MDLYSYWKDQADTALYTNWASEMVGKMQHFSSGIQLADEGSHKRTDRFMSNQNFEKRQALRPQRDPEGRFWAWHSAPEHRMLERPENWWYTNLVYNYGDEGSL